MSKRIIFASREVGVEADASPAKMVRVFSFFPIDRADCECASLVLQWQKKFGEATQKERQQLIEQTPFLTCPRDKTKLKHYEIVCRKCKETQGFCWASDASLVDWCDFHYVQWTRGDQWRGCFTPHISPITQQLCFECCCGQDTRDFRANMKLSQRIAENKERANSIGREFNQPNSKFLVRIAK